MGNNSIIKNSVLLYSRMFVSMIISFYTTRVVLSVLGVEDYGLRNVVAGFASMFTYFNGVLQAGTSRFLALYIGSGEHDKLKKCFGNTIVIHISIALLILVIPITSILIFAISYGICHVIQSQIQPSFARLIIICSISMVLYAILYLYMVLSKDNRQKITNTIKRKLHI